MQQYTRQIHIREDPRFTRKGHIKDRDRGLLVRQQAEETRERSDKEEKNKKKFPLNSTFLAGLSATGIHAHIASTFSPFLPPAAPGTGARERCSFSKPFKSLRERSSGGNRRRTGRPTAKVSDERETQGSLCPCPHANKDGV